MNKEKIITLVIAVAALLISAYLIWPEWFGFCESHDRGDEVFVCSSPYAVDIGIPLISFTIAFLVMSLIALAARMKAFYTWIKFSMVYAAIALILMVVFRDGVGGAGLAGFSLTILSPQMLAYLLSGLYALISLVIFSVDFVSRSPSRNQQK